jgi:hypothetical protein
MEQNVYYFKPDATIRNLRCIYYAIMHLRLYISIYVIYRRTSNLTRFLKYTIQIGHVSRVALLKIIGAIPSLYYVEDNSNRFHFVRWLWKIVFSQMGAVWPPVHTVRRKQRGGAPRCPTPLRGQG